MNIFNRFKISVQGISNAFARFPLTASFILAVVIINSLMINEREFDFEKYLATFAVGAFLSMVFQMIFEGFSTKNTARILFMVLTLLLTLAYYLTLMNAGDVNMEIWVKTSVALFALLVGFLWVPSIKSPISFNETFMAGFKAFFIAFFFSVVIMMGLSLIYAATNELLFDVNDKIYPHTANIAFVLFAVMYFLSLTPRYPGKQTPRVENEDGLSPDLSKATFCPKYLEILLSYIITPLSMIFTLILLIYIVTNIRGSFWEDALLEPMLVSYIVVVILLYILSSRLENRFSHLFRKVFPKVLLPIVLFQTVNSFLRIGEVGLTYTRYYVILFGIFAFFSGLVFTFMSIKKNGLVPLFLILCVFISIVPPIDAFTVSRTSQIKTLENVLVDKGMLVDDAILPNPDIDLEARRKIAEAARYLDQMDYVDDIAWFPDDFDYYRDFDHVFGFSPYEDFERDDDHFYLYTDINGLVDIKGYDFFVESQVYYSKDQDVVMKDFEFIKDGKPFTLVHEVESEDIKISLKDGEGHTMVSISGNDIIDKFKDAAETSERLPLDSAYILSENDKGGLKMVIQTIDIYRGEDGYRFSADFYLLIKINE